MKYNNDYLFFKMSEFNDEMDGISIDDDQRIIDFVDRLEKFIYEHGLICRRYDLYKDGWYAFERCNRRNPKKLTLYALFVYLFIYSREEHMCGGYEYGASYTRTYKNGTIPCIIKEIINRLEKAAINEDSESDKAGSWGIAGELFVAAELTRRGYIATLTSKNTKAIDILVAQKEGDSFVGVQVKACNKKNQKKWKMSKSSEENVKDNLYYVLVNLREGNEPYYYVVPSEYIAYRIKEDYTKWLHTPRKDGNNHPETSMRTFEFIDEDEENQFRDAWYLFGI
ncbi:hypothetical protein [Parasporobacterium paucivorans]|uniref:PD(D/E)XK endonuclease domain-containing protein n=1 Tax=Parasporobacterium paucivorans DSM 15970 TaxID=1122934 RepID=A0A1M6HWV7_9FIRM|nr:hypothetical protein [Parasporobacterium paucivorans]SHJ26564.1 hypothetical protein SAMN02745691_01628 [Parasporobacterium paucivorans DSM 15970]